MAFTPLEADNLIYTFHFYEPKNFTHQGAYWGWPMWISFSGFPYPSSPAAVAPRLAQVADDVKPHLTHYGEARWNRARLATQLIAPRNGRRGTRSLCGAASLAPTARMPRRRIGTHG